LSKPEANKAEAASPAAQSGLAIEQMDLEISFDLGRIQVPVASLRTLQAGYVFELDTTLNEPVTIRANGRRIGRGRLVQIGDRIGVQTTELAGHGN